jgi:glutamate dehydrogenase (NAD(P)+)
MQDCFSFADDLGPTKIIHVHEPSIGLRAILVIDNVAKGPSIGGVRMAPDVSVEECVRLARAMTYKNAAAGLPHGGGKAVLYGDPKMPSAQKETLIRGMAQALRYAEDYIFAPDMGTDEVCMAWVKDEIGRVVALPREVGGIPLDEIGATGFGLGHVAEVAQSFAGMKLEGARVVIQGFGAVGSHAARFLGGRGAVLVGVADSQGTLHNPDGLDVNALVDLKAAGQSVVDYAGGERLDLDAVVGLDCDIWIPAARPDVIREDNVGQLKARLVIEGANIPVTAGAERILHERGVLCVPDFIANAGGVICAAMEYQGATESAALQTIEEKLRRNTRQVLEDARRRGILPREAARDVAEARVRKAMGLRRFSLFSTAPGWV